MINAGVFLKPTSDKKGPIVKMYADTRKDETSLSAMDDDSHVYLS
jgi:hypothetical protein